MKVTREEFVKTWQKSSTVMEVANKTGLTPATCRRYAWQFRKKGVELKKLDEGKKKPDWESLKKLAANLSE